MSHVFVRFWDRLFRFILEHDGVWSWLHIFLVVPIVCLCTKGISRWGVLWRMGFMQHRFSSCCLVPYETLRYDGVPTGLCSPIAATVSDSELHVQVKHIVPLEVVGVHGHCAFPLLLQLF
jgi:hypothetical protein